MKFCETVSSAAIAFALTTGGLGLATVATVASAADSSQSQSVDQMSQKHDAMKQDAMSAKNKMSDDGLNDGAQGKKMSHGSTSNEDNSMTGSDVTNDGMQSKKRTSRDSTSNEDNSMPESDVTNDGMEAKKRMSNDSTNDNDMSSGDQ